MLIVFTIVCCICEAPPSFLCSLYLMKSNYRMYRSSFLFILCLCLLPCIDSGTFELRFWGFSCRPYMGLFWDIHLIASRSPPGHGQRTYWFKVILPATSAPLEKQHALGAENARDFCLVRFSLRFYVTLFCLHVGSFGFPFRLLFGVIGLHFAPLWAPLGSIWAPRGSLWVAFSCLFLFALGESARSTQKGIYGLHPWDMNSSENHTTNGELWFCALLFRS